MFSPTNAIVAGALALAIGGVMLVAQPFDRPGATVPGAATDAEASASPSAFPGPDISAIPSQFQDGYWLGSYHEVPGLDNGASDRMALTIGPYFFALFDETNGHKLASSAGITPDGQLRLLTSIGGTECTKGDVGLYAWSLSEGPRSPLTRLTIEAGGTDDCAQRAAAISGEYVTSGCRIPDNWCLNELPPGTYGSAFIEPRGPAGDAYKVRLGALEYTVPAGWAHADDSPRGGYVLMPAAAFAPQIADPDSWQDGIRIWSRPAALSAASMCAGKVDPSVGRTVDELAAWIEAHPGLVVDDQRAITIGGYGGVMLDLDVAPDWTATCAEWTDDPGPFVPLFTDGGWLKADGSSDDGYWWGPGGFPGGQASDPIRVILLDLGGGDTVAISIDSFEAAGQAALVEQAMPIVETFQFPD